MQKLEKLDNEGNRTGEYGMYSDDAAERMTSGRGAKWVRVDGTPLDEGEEKSLPIGRKRKRKPKTEQ